MKKECFVGRHLIVNNSSDDFFQKTKILDIARSVIKIIAENGL